MMMCLNLLAFNGLKTVFWSKVVSRENAQVSERREKIRILFYVLSNKKTRSGIAFIKFPADKQQSVVVITFVLS